jgi:hypothetical protein
MSSGQGAHKHRSLRPFFRPLLRGTVGTSLALARTAVSDAWAAQPVTHSQSGNVAVISKYCRRTAKPDKGVSLKQTAGQDHKNLPRSGNCARGSVARSRLKSRKPLIDWDSHGLRQSSGSDCAGAVRLNFLFEGFFAPLAQVSCIVK